MATIYYTAKVKESRLLELPEEAQTLDLQPGEEISVGVDRNGIEVRGSLLPNEAGLAAMREIAERQRSRAAMEGSDVVKLVREARTGAM